MALKFVATISIIIPFIPTYAYAITYPYTHYSAKLSLVKSNVGNFDVIISYDTSYSDQLTDMDLLF